MRRVGRAVLGLVPAIPVFYLAYLATNLLLEFVVVFTELAKIYWETREYRVFMDFRMSWKSAFEMMEGYLLIYIFIGLVVIYNYLSWYYNYVKKPAKSKREVERVREVRGIPKEVVYEDREQGSAGYRKVEALRVEEDIESKELMREILEAVKVTEDREQGEEPVNEPKKQEKVEKVEKEPDYAKEEFEEEFGFMSMVTKKKAEDVLKDVDEEEEILFEVLDRKK